MGTHELVAAIVLAVIFAIIFAPLGDWVTKSRRTFWLRLLTLTVLRRRRIRVSCGALLKVAVPSGYILARMKLRPDAFGPFGGAFKYTKAGAAELEALGFEPQSLDRRLDQGIACDLRGFVEARNLAAFIDWFHEGKHRESDSECLRRELTEELREVNATGLLSYVGTLEFSYVREVREGPDLVPGDDKYQLRILRVYQLHPNDETSRRFRDELVRLSGANEHLLAVSEKEIRQGRGQRGGTIGHHAGYLLGQRRLRPDLPPF